ncbi:molybdenum cofactor guanylyltransferase [Devosia sp. YR412]|uniref:molybdenum cofactor guanylyltransferase n=1 Tax=Devosia sp. YR412 TaxID=1881030 RepID=UPI0008D67E4D|nr:molybdenum cofactor guanylyltransferase [Devosia sp. YR412]SEQ58220.1 molybdenum cofactor guanylyltransferase [Devosia sp. YR412]
MPVHAVIIAGGKGERLGGVRKADLLLGGRRLVDRVAGALGPVESLMIAVGTQGDGRGRRDDSMAVVDIDAPVGGPLAGLAAAVESLRLRGITSGLLASAAVDTPFLPEDVVERLVEALGDAPVAYAAWGEQFYPPNAVWRLDALQDLPTQVRAGTAPTSLKRLLQNLNAVQLDWRHHVDSNPFLNINTVADLIALQKLAGK